MQQCILAHVELNARYTLDTTTGVLSITGTGAMTDYSSKKAPWYSQSSYIKTIEIADGITSIGQSAFTYCKYCTSITVPKSITLYSTDPCPYHYSLEIIAINKDPGGQIFYIVRDYYLH